MVRADFGKGACLCREVAVNGKSQLRYCIRGVVIMHNAISQEHKLFSYIFSYLFLLFMTGCAIVMPQPKGSDLTEVKELFAAPPTEYSSAPLWV